ncbi:MAG: PASTA domain-containing protein [Prevotella sp.]
MKQSEFFGKFKSLYLWGNLAAMFVVVLVVCLAVRYGLGVYTHHGESIAIPDLRHKQVSDVEHILANMGMVAVVSDTGYVKTFPADCVLEQTPVPGSRVKSGHVVYLIVNASKSPTITLPDIIDNCSLREATAKLRAMGFSLTEPEYVTGEKDWVYGVLAKGRPVSAGDRISVDDRLTIQVGSGLRDESDSVEYVDDPALFGGHAEEDPFEVVTGPTGSLEIVE